MEKLLVLTDLHITEPGETIIGLDPGARLQATLAHALARHPDAARLIVTGDLTHHGRPAQYRRLKAILDPLPLPVLLLPGNHDRRAGFEEVFPDRPRDWVEDLGEWRLIGLDTTDEPSHAGRLDGDRLERLDAALAGAGRSIVFAHHPPFLTGLPGMDAIRLADGHALLDRLARHDAHLVCGHVHRTASGSARGVPWTMFKSPCHQAPLDFVTPDSSLSIDEPAAYGVILLGPEGAICHSEDVLDTGPPGRDMASA